MHNVISVLAVTDGMGVTMGGFFIMTVASICLLCVLPRVCRRHISWLGAYAHEISHGAVSLLTAGKWHCFVVGDAGGLCITSGGNRKAVTAAGYIGTIVLGAIALARSAQSESLAVTLQVCSVLLALSTLKSGDLQTAAVGTVVATLLGLSSTLVPSALATRFLSNLMGIILVWEGTKALKTLWTISAGKTGIGSDAEVMASLTGRSAMYWATVFGGIALVAFLVIVSVAMKAPTGPT